MAGKFKIGDLVTFVNDYGVKWPERTVVGTDDSAEGEPRYFLNPTDSPWMSKRESQLILDAEDPVLCVEGGHKIRHTTINFEQWFLLGLTQHAFKTLELATQYARDNPLIS